MNRAFLASIFLTSVAFSAFFALGVEDVSAASKAADSKTILSEIKAGKSVIVDVRELREIQTGMVKGGIWLSTSSLSAQSDRSKEILKSFKKDQKIYVYCAVGGRAGRFARNMRTQGYDVVNLGGFSDLKSNGFPTSKVKEKATKGCPWLCGSSKAKK